MRFKFLLSSVIAFFSAAGFCSPADFVGSSGTVFVDRTTAVPGDTIKAGSYTVSVTEQLADRMIVRIDSTTSKEHAIFLGVPSSVSKLGGGQGAVPWGVGITNRQTMRGFVFANGNAVEFVYPKADAAALAKSNGTTVVALDPRSEGKVALKSLSQDELSIVNLWLLSMTTTGVDSKTPAVLAKHYDGQQIAPQPAVAKSIEPVYPMTPGPGVTLVAPVQRAAVTSSPTVRNPPAATSPAIRRVPEAIAAAKPPTVKLEPAPPKAKAVVASQKSIPVAPTEVASLDEARSLPIRQHRAITQLPHTASSLPLFWLVGMLSLLGAGAIRMGRAGATERSRG